MSEELTVGERIGYFREQRGLSQKALGELVGRSGNWCYTIERGQLPVDRLSVVIDLAGVLRVRDLSDLTGGGIKGAMSSPERKHEAVPAIRRTLALPSPLLRLGRAGR